MIQILKQPGRLASTELADWGPVKEPLGDLIAQLRGREAAQTGEPDYGIWECSPGRYERGARVFHQKFGYGAVVTAEGDKLEIEFDKAGRKRVMAGFVVPAQQAG